MIHFLEHVDAQYVAAVFGGRTNETGWRLWESNGRIFEDHTLPDYEHPLLTRKWVIYCPIIYVPELRIIGQFGALINNFSSAGGSFTGKPTKYFTI